MTHESDISADRERSVADLFQEADSLALRVGCRSHDELFKRCDRGDFRGTILESKVSMIRFLLEDDETLLAAE